jgi:hypothetical protein
MDGQVTEAAKPKDKTLIPVSEAAQQALFKLWNKYQGLQNEANKELESFKEFVAYLRSELRVPQDAELTPDGKNFSFTQDNSPLPESVVAELNAENIQSVPEGAETPSKVTQIQATLHPAKPRSKRVKAS